eukprot:SAG31_NODE_7506_length_1669_cov_2.182166_4_plen_86_part_00
MRAAGSAIECTERASTDCDADIPGQEEKITQAVVNQTFWQGVEDGYKGGVFTQVLQQAAASVIAARLRSFAFNPCDCVAHRPRQQ